MTYPTHGDEIMRLRRQGKRPAGVVSVGFGGIDYPPPSVTVGDRQRVSDLDFRFLHDLDICLVGKIGDDSSRSAEAAGMILKVQPRNLDMYVVDIDYWMTLIRDYKRVSWMWYGADFLRYCGDDENHPRQH